MLYIYNNYTNDLFYRAWKNRIKLLKEENQTEIYQTLCILQSEPCRELFECRMKQFINTWAKEEPAFINYFRENYQNRAGIYCVHYTLCTYNTYWIHTLCHSEKWAKCYRHFQHGDTDTNMYLERCNYTTCIHVQLQLHKPIIIIVL